MKTIKNKIGFLMVLANKLSQSKRPVVYIAGKVTGLPVGEYKAKFNEARAMLEKQGYHVINPCDFIGSEESWATAMRMASSLLNMAEHIYLLDDWQDSEGAKWEFNQAVKFDINVLTPSA